MTAPEFEITKEMIEAVWTHMPSAYDTDMEDEDAAQRLIRAIFQAAARNRLR